VIPNFTLKFFKKPLCCSDFKLQVLVFYEGLSIGVKINQFFKIIIFCRLIINSHYFLEKPCHLVAFLHELLFKLCNSFYLIIFLLNKFFIFQSYLIILNYHILYLLGHYFVMLHYKSHIVNQLVFNTLFGLKIYKVLERLVVFCKIGLKFINFKLKLFVFGLKRVL
jgi:hypothetical protein